MNPTGKEEPVRQQSGQKRNTSKRSELRARRHKEQIRNRFITIAAIVVAALGIAALLIIPNLPKKVNLSEIALPEIKILPQADLNTLGDPNAPIKVEEFYDFNCSHCLDYALNQEPGIIEKYVATGKVYYVSYAFPFLAPTSTTAAEAAFCAMDQGKYWEYKETLFLNSSGGIVDAFGNDHLFAYAEKLGLDVDQFKACFNGTEFEQRITADMAYGSSMGVTGTPSFLVNGVLFSRADLEQAILDALN